jgi:hypothetical protein
MTDITVEFDEFTFGFNKTNFPKVSEEGATATVTAKVLLHRCTATKRDDIAMLTSDTLSTLFRGRSSTRWFDFAWWWTRKA